MGGLEEISAGLNPVDAAGLALVGVLAPGSAFVVWLMHLLISVPLVKLGVPVGLALYAWLDPRPQAPPWQRAGRVGWSILGVVIAFGFGRAIQDGLPPRDRPNSGGIPGFEFPPLGDLPLLAEWSSFPSDHAVLAGALATAAWAYSWRLGLASAFWGVFVVALPRLFFGFHYLTDLLAGGVFGVLVVLLVMRLGRPAVTPEALLWLERRAPTVLALGLFLVAFEFITLFSTTRRGIGAVRDVLHALG
jgi:undecaprenyl-diphosphatase